MILASLDRDLEPAERIPMATDLTQRDRQYGIERRIVAVTGSGLQRRNRFRGAALHRQCATQYIQRRGVPRVDPERLGRNARGVRGLTTVQSKHGPRQRIIVATFVAAVIAGA